MVPPWAPSFALLLTHSLGGLHRAKPGEAARKPAFEAFST